MRYHSILCALIEVLEQERSLVSTLDSAVYTAPGSGAFRSSVGAHLRHNLDHFTSYFAGLPEGRIDYEQRRRDDGIARSTKHALADIGKQIAALERLMQDEPGSDFLQVREESDSAAEGELRWLDSSVGRELQFLLGHTVHHHAIIALLLARQGVELPEGFGVAPSTQRYERRYSGERG